MKTTAGSTRVAMIVGVALLGMMLAPWPAEAQRTIRARLARLQAEVTDLRAELAGVKGRMAQLNTTVEFQGRQDSVPRPGVGTGLCADPCATDSDEDGVNDCEDLCPCDANNADGDGDQMPDCFDPCPDDATNDCMNPCRHDSDGDGVNDCEDPCPFDPAEPTDTDGDGIPNCQDPCPDDAQNMCFEPCPLDQDGDGMKDCRDVCPWLPDGTVAPGCPIPMSVPNAGRK